MKLKQVGTILPGQDGAIWKNTLFRLNAKGQCWVYDLSELDFTSEQPCDLAPKAEFVLDRADEIVPHSNAVMFGKEYFAAEDEFPLLYSNIYNNYAKAENKRKGVCCVYRIQRTENGYTSTLVQLIEIGFTENTEHWASSSELNDVRPYGNFTIDLQQERYYAFTMRDHCHVSRYFSFVLPKLSDGLIDPAFGVRKVILQTSDILTEFDCEYHKFVQGACCHNGRIYSVEGFTHHDQAPPALRVIDPVAKRQILFADLTALGDPIEPEFIDFYGETCLYGDGHGQLFVVEF